MQTLIKTQFLMGWVLALVFSGNVLAAGPEARLDRTRIGEGETLALSINVPGGSRGKPDLSVLAQDFDILDHSQSMHMSMVNGHSSSSKTWQFVLAPKRTGKLEIPAITVDGASTRPLSLEVLPAAEAAKLGPVAPVLLEIEAEPEQPYVQQKVVYTVRLLTRVPLRRASVSKPRIRDAMIEPLGAERKFSSQRDGQQYQVIERRYVVFPQRSGALEIEGPILSAQLPEPNQRGNGRGQHFPGRDPFADFDRLFGRSGFPDIGGAFAQTRPIQLRGQKLVLDVQAQPAGTASPWLPAESLSLNESWSANPPQFRVGEPITRTIAITAQGLSGAQLPELDAEAPAGIKVYPDKSQSQTRVDGDTLVSQKVLKAALVPSRAGKLELPEVRLAWWDTRTGTQQVARLPARDVEVLPAAVGSPSSTIERAPPVVEKTAQARETTTEPVKPNRTRPAASAAGARVAGGDGFVSGYWPWIAAVLALAWLVTLGLWLRARRGRSAGSPAEARPAAVPTPKTGRLLKQIEHACQANDAAAARRALLEWAAARWPQDPPRRIDTLAQRLGDNAARALQELDQCLYSDATSPWDGVAAWLQLSAALQKSVVSERSGSKDSSLPPLYPQGA